MINQPASVPEPQAAHDPVRRWAVAPLVDAVPGTTRRIWLTDLIPSLVAAGVLRKNGRGWYGRLGDIESFLLGRFEAAPTTRGRRR